MTTQQGGRWVTVMGRKLYIEEGQKLEDAMKNKGKKEDLVDKQDREIKEQAERTKELNEKNRPEKTTSFSVDTKNMKDNQSVNDLAIKYFKSKGIGWRRDKHGQLTANIDGDGVYRVFKYKGNGKFEVDTKA